MQSEANRASIESLREEAARRHVVEGLPSSLRDQVSSEPWLSVAISCVDDFPLGDLEVAVSRGGELVDMWRVTARGKTR